MTDQVDVENESKTVSDNDSTTQDESNSFYERAETYWSTVPATIDGMLGGFGCISHCDVQGSETFLKKIFQLKCRPGMSAALDCGAGIGRITKKLLLKHFKKVDLVEQNIAFVEEGKKFLEFENRVGNFIHCGLQNFEPDNESYDVIWCQWVLGHLTNEHLVKFLIRCKSGLRPNGIIVVKENIAGENIDVDVNDSSITRPLTLFKSLFKLAGYKSVKECRQLNFPKRLYPVHMFALKPASDVENLNETQQTAL